MSDNADDVVMVTPPANSHGVSIRVRNLSVISVPYKSLRDAQDSEQVLHADGNRTSDSSSASALDNLFVIDTLHNRPYKLHMCRHIPRVTDTGISGT